MAGRRGARGVLEFVIRNRVEVRGKFRIVDGDWDVVVLGYERGGREVVGALDLQLLCRCTNAVQRAIERRLERLKAQWVEEEEGHGNRAA